MSSIKHYINEIGLNILLDCGTDLSSVTAAQMEVKMPSGKTVVWPATPWTLDGNTKYLLHITVANDLIQIGQYKIQAYIQQTSNGVVTWQALGETAEFIIYDVFK